MTDERTNVLVRVILILMILLFMMIHNHPAKAHDPDEHQNDEWYSSLKQPGTQVSCCGLSDAYFCDNMTVDKGIAYCEITDDRDDDSRGRPHIPLGTKIAIPDDKLIDSKQASLLGNPTGHGIIWVRGGIWAPGLFTVYCYMMPPLT